jgi:regulator of replication initiation timing
VLDRKNATLVARKDREITALKEILGGLEEANQALNRENDSLRPQLQAERTSSTKPNTSQTTMTICVRGGHNSHAEDCGGEVTHIFLHLPKVHGYQF